MSTSAARYMAGYVANVLRGRAPLGMVNGTHTLCPGCGGDGYWVDYYPDENGEPDEPYQIQCQCEDGLILKPGGGS